MHDDGALDEGPDGRVDIKYKPDEDARIYRAAARNLVEQADDTGPQAAPRQPSRPAPEAAARSSTERHSAARAIIVYTDGACTGNPGPMGIGVVVLREQGRKELGEHIGFGTNNIAELTAIERAIDLLQPDERDRSVLVHADSAYAIGVLSGAYKAKKNVELIDRIRAKASRFPHLRFVKVAGHAGVPENERCDQLATQAIARGPGRR